MVESALMAFSALATMVAAGAAWRSAVASGRSSRAHLLLPLMERYDSDEFHKAMKRLREFQRLSNHKNGFAADYGERVKRNDSTADDLSPCRRLTSHFYYNLKAVCEEGLLDSGLVSRVFDRGTFEFFLEIGEPLDRAYKEVVLERAHEEAGAEYFQKFLRRWY